MLFWFRRKPGSASNRSELDTQTRADDDAFTMSDADREQHDKALSLLVKMQRTLIRRLGEYVAENESSLRLAADGAEGYGYTVHQLDELFLSRLNLVERTIAELQKYPAGGASRYRTQCFVASRGEVEQEINSRLEKLSDARILGVSVSPAVGRAGPDAPVLDAAESDCDATDPSATEAPVEGDGSPGDQLLVTVLYYGPAPQTT
jgi:hypothetical protein